MKNIYVRLFWRQTMNKVNIQFPGFLTILTLIFVVAKIFGKITWSWWIVFSPFLIGVSLALFIILIVIIVAVWIK